MVHSGPACFRAAYATGLTPLCGQLLPRCGVCVSLLSQWLTVLRCRLWCCDCFVAFLLFMRCGVTHNMTAKTPCTCDANALFCAYARMCAACVIAGDAQTHQRARPEAWARAGQVWWAGLLRPTTWPRRLPRRVRLWWIWIWIWRVWVGATALALLCTLFIVIVFLWQRDYVPRFA